ncbi:MAG: hypothetical protein MUO53_01180 [Maribacter sp.]|nr:hypothetical protein [Maribacter sp.]
MLTTYGYGQKKSELLDEINHLRTELEATKALVTTAQKNEKISTARAESFETQVQELQAANGTLLKNLNSFAEVSNKNSENVNRAMSSLGEKEKQLKDINDAISKNDSTAIIILTNAKQTLGENARISVQNGEVVISESLETLFGGDTAMEVASSAEAFLGQIAAILNANPNSAVTVEGLSMTGELDLAARQAAAVASVLQKKFAVDPERITILGKDGNFKEGIAIKIHPKYNRFYIMVKENIKK